MKQTTDADYIQQLITEGEHVHQDFKFAISDARKIAKSLSAFANTGGGRLLIGVKITENSRNTFGRGALHDRSCSYNVL